jgi:hypothetical protein
MSPGLLGDGTRRYDVAGGPMRKLQNLGHGDPNPGRRPPRPTPLSSAPTALSRSAMSWRGLTSGPPPPSRTPCVRRARRGARPSSPDHYRLLDRIGRGDVQA